MQNNITPGHVRAFQAVTSRIYGETSLWSCTINGEAGVAIVLIDRPSPEHIAIMPLFVAINESMDVEFEGEATGGSSGGGPKDPRDSFDAAQQDMTAPTLLHNSRIAQAEMSVDIVMLSFCAILLHNGRSFCHPGR